MTATMIEYDFGTFLDECQPLFTGDRGGGNNNSKTISKGENRFGNIRRRCISDAPLTNNPLSKMKKNIAFRKKAKKQKNETDASEKKVEQERTEASTTKTKTTATTSTTTTTSNIDVTTDQQRDGFVFATNPLDNETVDLEMAVDDEACPEIEDDVELFGGDHHNRYEKHFTVNKAAAFVKRRTNFLRRNHIKALKSRCFEKQHDSDIEIPSKDDDSKISAENSCDTYNTNTATTCISTCNNDSSTVVEKTNLDDKTNDLRVKRMPWKNVRKSVNYVVRLIRRESKPDDEMLLMEEETNDFPSTQATPIRNRSRSYSTIFDRNNEQEEEDEDEEKVNFTAVNIKYLSPKGRKLDRFTYNTAGSSMRSSRKSSRKSSFDSCTNTSNFLSKIYLNKSKSLESIRVTGDGNNEELEQCFFHENDFEQDQNLQCIQNNLYNSTDDDLGSGQQFEVAEKGINEIIEMEVNNYMTRNNDEKKITKLNTRSSDVFHFNTQKTTNNATEDAVFPNVKHTSTISYSVNDLYDLFNKDKFMSFDTSFDDLVV